MVEAKCSMCGEILRSRKSKKNSARKNLLRKISNHMWTKHREAMIRRIKAGKSRDFENPTVQDFIEALKSSIPRALEIYETLRKHDWNRLKQVMDAIEDILPDKVRIAWQVIETLHDRGVKVP